MLEKKKKKFRVAFPPCSAQHKANFPCILLGLGLMLVLLLIWSDVGVPSYCGAIIPTWGGLGALISSSPQHIEVNIAEIDK